MMLNYKQTKTPAGNSHYNGFGQFGLMESWFCICNDLANPNNGLNLVPNPLQRENVTGDLCRNYADKNNQKISIYSARSLQSRSVKIGFCQQKLEKLKSEKQKRESWNLQAET